MAGSAATARTGEVVQSSRLAITRVNSQIACLVVWFIVLSFFCRLCSAGGRVLESLEVIALFLSVQFRALKIPLCSCLVCGIRRRNVTEIFHRHGLQQETVESCSAPVREFEKSGMWRTNGGYNVCLPRAPGTVRFHF